VKKGSGPFFANAVRKRVLTPFLARAAVAFLAGAAAVLGFSPFDLLPAALVALAVLVHLLAGAGTPRAALALGFAFGLGLFGAGVSWVYVSLSRFGGMPAPLAALATLGFCALLALFPAGAAWAEARLARGAPPALRAAIAFPAAWVLAEWLRGWVLTGFPWLSLGYAAIDDALAGFAPLGGVYAVSLALAGAAGLAWCAALGHGRWSALGALALLVAGGFALRSLEWTRPSGAPLRVALLQGNVPQELKFSPERYGRTLETYAALAEQGHARLTVLPETAVPRFLDSVDPAWLRRLAAAASRGGGDLLLGVPVRAGDAYYNSVVSLGDSPSQAYHKDHLVPFGEFVPPGFGWVVRVLAIPLSDFSRGGPRQRPLAVAGERLAVNICYEDAYGREIARQLPEATLLVNVSNVAWFGDSLAPAQHLQIQRMRALETGRWHLTAANTGITAAIAPDGAVRARMPQFVRGRLEAEVRGHAGATPYVRAGDWPALALAALALAFVALRARGS
jgi:apolipoprotein N-acyltransferase